MKLEVIIEKDETGYYVAEVPAFPGCVSQGRTLAEAKANIKEAIELYIESLQADGMPIPTEEDVEEAIVEVAA